MSFLGIIFLSVIKLFAYSPYFGSSYRLLTEKGISLEFNLIRVQSLFIVTLYITVVIISNAYIKIISTKHCSSAVMDRHKKIENRFGTLLGSSPFGLVFYTLWLQEDLLLLIKMIRGWRGCYASVAIILKWLPVITQIHQKITKKWNI